MRKLIDKTCIGLKGVERSLGDTDVVDQMLGRSDETLAQHADLFPWERTLRRLLAVSRSISDRGE